MVCQKVGVTPSPRRLPIVAQDHSATTPAAIHPFTNHTTPTTPPCGRPRPHALGGGVRHLHVVLLGIGDPVPVGFRVRQQPRHQGDLPPHPSGGSLDPTLIRIFVPLRMGSGKNPLIGGFSAGDQWFLVRLLTEANLLTIPISFPSTFFSIPQATKSICSPILRIVPPLTTLHHSFPHFLPQAYVTEVTDATTMSRAFGLLGLQWSPGRTGEGSTHSPHRLLQLGNAICIPDVSQIYRDFIELESCSPYGFSFRYKPTHTGRLFSPALPPVPFLLTRGGVRIIWSPISYLSGGGVHYFGWGDTHKGCYPDLQRHHSI